MAQAQIGMQQERIQTAPVDFGTRPGIKQFQGQAYMP